MHGHFSRSSRRLDELEADWLILSSLTAFVLLCVFECVGWAGWLSCDIFALVLRNIFLGHNFANWRAAKNSKEQLRGKFEVSSGQSHSPTCFHSTFTRTSNPI